MPVCPKSKGRNWREPDNRNKNYLVFKPASYFSLLHCRALTKIITPLIISGSALLSICLLFSKNHISENPFTPQHLPMPNSRQEPCFVWVLPRLPSTLPPLFPFPATIRITETEKIKHNSSFRISFCFS